MNIKKKKELILASVEDLVADLLYYDRKEDEELFRGDIEKICIHEPKFIDEMVEKFREQLILGIQ